MMQYYNDDIPAAVLHEVMIHSKCTVDILFFQQEIHKLILNGQANRL